MASVTYTKKIIYKEGIRNTHFTFLVQLAHFVCIDSKRKIMCGWPLPRTRKGIDSFDTFFKDFLEELELAASGKSPI